MRRRAARDHPRRRRVLSRRLAPAVHPHPLQRHRGVGHGDRDRPGPAPQRHVDQRRVGQPLRLARRRDDRPVPVQGLGAGSAPRSAPSAVRPEHPGTPGWRRPHPGPFRTSCGTPTTRRCSSTTSPARSVPSISPPGVAPPSAGPGLYERVSASPSGEHLLTVEVERPFSWLVRAGSFPKDVTVRNRSGEIVASIARLPLADARPHRRRPHRPAPLHVEPDPTRHPRVGRGRGRRRSPRHGAPARSRARARRAVRRRAGRESRAPSSASAESRGPRTAPRC